MKTSTKILIATFVLMGVSLVVYDFGLKAEYQKHDYADPFRDYTIQNFKDFDEVQLNSSTAINIILVKGPFKVMTNPAAGDFLKVEQKGRRIVITAAFPEHYRSFTSQYLVYVSCPNISLLKTDAWYTADHATITDTFSHDLRWKPTLMSGFTLDSLHLDIDHASNLVLENNKINKLSGTIGAEKDGGPALVIGNHNEFLNSNLTILNRGQLIVKGTDTRHLNYALADSATLKVNGAAVKHLSNPK